MRENTYWKAKTFIIENRVTLVNASSNFFHFRVKDYDVFYKLNKKTLLREWSCCAVDKKADYGCIMFKGDQTKAFCSHTKACEIYLRERDLYV